MHMRKETSMQIWLISRMEQYLRMRNLRMKELFIKKLASSNLNSLLCLNCTRRTTVILLKLWEIGRVNN